MLNIQEDNRLENVFVKLVNPNADSLIDHDATLTIFITLQCPYNIGFNYIYLNIFHYQLFQAFMVSPSQMHTSEGFFLFSFKSLIKY